MSKSLLNWFEKVLTENQLHCAIIAANEENPYGRAIVSLGVDYQERPKLLEVTIQEQETGDSLFSADKNSKKEFLRIQFQFTFPFTILPLASHEVAHFLHFLNRYLELPGFEMSELEDQIFFRYIWMTTKPALVPDLVLSLLGIILLNIDLFTQSIESISEGKKTYSQLLESMLPSPKQGT